MNNSSPVSLLWGLAAHSIYMLFHGTLCFYIKLPPCTQRVSACGTHSWLYLQLTQVQPELNMFTQYVGSSFHFASWLRYVDIPHKLINSTAIDATILQVFFLSQRASWDWSWISGEVHSPDHSSPCIILDRKNEQQKPTDMLLVFLLSLKSMWRETS